jgi:hypothetical protein
LNSTGSAEWVLAKTEGRNVSWAADTARHTPVSRTSKVSIAGGGDTQRLVFGRALATAYPERQMRPVAGTPGGEAGGH